MRIVLLDAYTTNPGDLSWSALERFGEVTVYEHTPPELTVERALAAPIVITNKTLITKEVMDQLPDLKYIGILSTGCNAVDLEAAKRRGIPVCNVPDYCTDSVAQMCFALILEITNSVGLHSTSVMDGEWARSRDFCYWKKPVVELSGKTMGIIGFGRTGRRIADMALAMGMKVLVSTRRQPVEADIRIEPVPLDELLAASDVIVIACSLNKENQGLICKATIEKMKHSAIVINTSRGPLINDEDLAEALNSGRIAGAGVDVLTVEPPQGSNPLIGAKNCTITPHIAWASYDARARLIDTAVANVSAFLEGKPIHVANL